MPVERTTPQLVKKGKGKKRPGYRGKGEYQGGRGIGGSKSSKGGDKGTSGSTGNLGGGGGGQDSNYRRYSPPTKKTYTSKTIDSKPVTGRDYKRSRDDFVNTLNRNNKVAAERAGTKFTPYQGGSRMQKSNSGLGSLIKFLAGLAIPGAGFLLSQGGKLKDGLMGFNDSIQNSDFGRSTSLMDYLDMKKFGGYDEREMARRINMDEAKNLQARIDAGEFGGFGIQTPKNKPTFSDPFANTVGTTTKVNAPASDAVSTLANPELNRMKGYLDGIELPNSKREIPTVNGVPMIDTGSVYQNNLDFFKNLNKGIVKNNEPPMVNTDNVMQGSVLDAKPKKGIMEMISESLFPEGDFQNIKATAPDQRTYNIEATKDLIENNPLGILGEIYAPVTSLVTSPFYDATQAFQRMEPDSGIKGFAKAFNAEEPVSSALERAYGATLPLAERFANLNNVSASETVPATEDITIQGGMLTNPFMETQIQPRIIAAENAYYNQGKMPSPFLADKIRMNMELGNARGFMGPGFANGGLASMFTRRG